MKLGNRREVRPEHTQGVCCAKMAYRAIIAKAFYYDELVLA
jgi:hypothetical protein